MKSKIKARTITQTSRKYVSCMFKDYCFQNICHILTPVGCILKVLIYFFPFYDKEGVFHFIKKSSKGIPEIPVYFVFEPVYFDAVFLDMCVIFLFKFFY